MSLGQRSGEAAESVSLQRSPSPTETLDLTIAGLGDLGVDQLRLQWRNHLGGTAPTHLPPWLLLKILAYRVQAAALGDLDKATGRSIRVSRGDAIDLGGSPFTKRKPRTRDGIGLNPGALLVREWKGKLERVMVLDGGFAWNGRSFGSLSQVAKAITGTSWNGHRFFGLRSVKGHNQKGQVAHLGANEDRAREAARSVDLGHAETNDYGRKRAKGIGREETERVVNAKRYGAHLTRRRASNPEAKPPVSIGTEPRQDRTEIGP
jgi:Protein of unknown function (DUF2924)